MTNCQRTWRLLIGLGMAAGVATVSFAQTQTNAGTAAEPPSVELLLENLKSPKPALRAEAAKQLGICHDRRGVEPLIKALSDEEDSVRQEAAGALGEFKVTQVVEPLL